MSGGHAGPLLGIPARPLPLPQLSIVQPACPAVADINENTEKARHVRWQDVVVVEVRQDNVGNHLEAIAVERAGERVRAEGTACIIHSIPCVCANAGAN